MSELDQIHIGFAVIIAIAWTISLFLASDHHNARIEMLEQAFKNGGCKLEIDKETLGRKFTWPNGKEAEL
jgi:hypothetical protein